MRTLYFDCFSGASGNMILGALIAAGVDRDELTREIAKLNIPEFRLEISEADRSGIKAIHVDVKVPHEHVHRHLSDIEKLIDQSGLSHPVKERAKAIFSRLAEAEAKIHGINVDKVHFHEVGAMDAVVDVVGSCVGFEMLGIERFVCSPINVGNGFAQMAHGKFPVPPPAVSELLTGAIMYSNEVEGELTTPTGAAIIATVCESYGRLPEIMVQAAGYGAGTREYKNFPNVLRVILGTTDEGSGKVDIEMERLVEIETNIDDLSPQILGFVMERVFEMGALDCWFTQIQMKKNRPATKVSILCEPTDSNRMTEFLFSETTTLGVRLQHVERHCLPRTFEKVVTKFGEIDVKIARHNGKIVNVQPEYDDLRKAAISHGVPLQSVAEEVRSNFDVNK